jgi:hypothetical protein
MKQFRITSADFLDLGVEGTIPDAVLSPDDSQYVNTLTATNGIVKHLQQVVSQLSQDDTSNE